MVELLMSTKAFDGIFYQDSEWYEKKYTLLNGGCAWFSWATIIPTFWYIKHIQAMTLLQNTTHRPNIGEIFEKHQNFGFWWFFGPGSGIFKISAAICDAKWKFDLGLHF